MDSGMELAGVTLAERYTLQRRLGGGGMGEVWLGQDSRLRRQVAVKVMLPVPGIKSVQRFKLEAAILAGMAHPGITVVHDAGRHDAYRFIVMELLKGQDLARVLAAHPKGLPIPRVLKLARQTIDALAAAHQKEIFHRDVKPANVFVQDGDQVKICDFGIARSPAGTSNIKTSTGMVIGTPAYMSPEQCEGQEADARSDLYAVGVVMFEMLTGEPPFRPSQSLLQLMRQHIEQAPSPPSRLRPGVPRELEALVLGLLQKRPGDRPNAEELASGLARLVAADSVPTGPVDSVRLTLRSVAPTAPTVTATRSQPGPTRPAYSLRHTLEREMERRWRLTCMAFSPNAHTLAAGDQKGGVHVWNWSTGTHLHYLTSRQPDPVRVLGFTFDLLAPNRVRALAFSPDGHTLATATADGAIRSWDIQAGVMRNHLTGHRGLIDCVAFSPDGRTLATSGDRSLYVWDIPTGAQRFALHLAGGVKSVAFSPDLRTLAAGGYCGVVRIVDGRRRWHPRSRAFFSAVAFSPDGRTLAAGGRDGYVHLWDAHTGKEHRQVTGHAGSIRHLAFSPDGHALGSAEKYGAVIVRDVGTGEQFLVLTAEDNREAVCGLAFSPDGGTLAICGYSEIQLWSTRT